MNKSSLIIDLFKFLCLLTAGFMIGFWIWEYLKNDDITLIEIKTLKEADDTHYPEMTLFVSPPFIKQYFRNISLKTNKETYLSYLWGNTDGNDSERDKFHERISYEKSTIKLFDFLARVDLVLSSGRIETFYASNEICIIDCKHNSHHSCNNCNQHYDIKDCPYLHFKNNYNGFYGDNGRKKPDIFVKSFGVGVNRTYTNDVLSVNLHFHPNFTDALDQKFLYGSFNYPHQVFRNFVYSFPILVGSNKPIVDYFYSITSFEVIKRRNKHGKECIENSKSFDHFIIKQEIEKIGCRAPYHLTHDQFPICQKAQELQHFSQMRLIKRLTIDPPPT